MTLNIILLGPPGAGVDSWTMPCSSSSLTACVPLPAPGGPSKMILSVMEDGDLIKKAKLKGGVARR